MANTFMTNMFIDTMQNAQREWIKTFVKTETLAAPMNALVDAQEAYAKAVVTSSEKLGNAIGDAVAKAVKA